jgi:hypothetical protein
VGWSSGNWNYQAPENVFSISGNDLLAGCGFSQGAPGHTFQGKLNLFNPDPQNRSNYMSSSGITSGSDGALWFATVNVAVGRVTTAGTFKFYPFPPNTNFDNGGSLLDMGNLRGIVTGTDGTLWLTNDEQIGHFV